MWEEGGTIEPTENIFVEVNQLGEEEEKASDLFPGRVRHFENFYFVLVKGKIFFNCAFRMVI